MVYTAKGDIPRKLTQAKTIAEKLVNRILDDYEFTGSEVAVMVNGLAEPL